MFGELALFVEAGFAHFAVEPVHAGVAGQVIFQPLRRAEHFPAVQTRAQRTGVCVHMLVIVAQLHESLAAQLTEGFVASCVVL